jgi:hypothetical protein
LKTRCGFGVGAIALSMVFLGSFGGCTIQEMGGQPVAVGPGGYQPPPGPIQAGCSYNATQLQGDPGAVFQIACPPGCTTGGLWGTDIYTADSGLCHAAIHAGAMSPDGGVVVVRIEPGQPAYRGSPRNGVTSWDYGAYGRSFTVGAAAGPPVMGQPAPGQPAAQWAGQPPATPAPPAAPQAIEAGCSYNSTQISDALGTAHLISCPPGCAASGGLWGTDVYTGDSAICKAAIHAGIISNNGGYVVVVLDGPRPAFRGSVRNQVTSGDYGNYSSSYRLQRP